MTQPREEALEAQAFAQMRTAPVPGPCSASRTWAEFIKAFSASPAFSTTSIVLPAMFYAFNRSRPGQGAAVRGSARHLRRSNFLGSMGAVRRRQRDGALASASRSPTNGGQETGPADAVHAAAGPAVLFRRQGPFSAGDRGSRVGRACSCSRGRRRHRPGRRPQWATLNLPGAMLCLPVTFSHRPGALRWATLAGPKLGACCDQPDLPADPRSPSGLFFPLHTAAAVPCRTSRHTCPLPRRAACLGMRSVRQSIAA